VPSRQSCDSQCESCVQFWTVHSASEVECGAAFGARPKVRSMDLHKPRGSRVSLEL
jgi:hypothetical protein